MISAIRCGFQTGADRAGAEAAMRMGIPVVGWVPKGKRDENGVIPERYWPFLKETEEWDYPPRTKMNVMDSDATIIFALGRLEGGSKLTYKLAKPVRPVNWFAVQHLRNLPAVDIAKAAKQMVDEIVGWLKTPPIPDPCVLNVAGNRESHAPGMFVIVTEVMSEVIRLSNGL